MSSFLLRRFTSTANAASVATAGCCASASCAGTTGALLLVPARNFSSSNSAIVAGGTVLSAAAFSSSDLSMLASAVAAPACARRHMGVSEVRPGDWLCSNCGENNFRFRTHCNLCSRARANPDAATGAPAAGAPAAAEGKGAAAAAAWDPASAGAVGGAAKDDPKSGSQDWTCAVCKSVNFKFRKECYSCREPRPEGVGAVGGMNRSGKAVEPRPGDWTCPECSSHNFRSRPRCFSCRTVRPDNAHTVGGGRGRGGAPGRFGESFDKLGKVTLRRGDWLCVACGEHNYSTRVSCFRCNEAKGESQVYKGSEEAEATLRRTSRADPNSPQQMLAGDWMCSGCNTINFRRRDECLKCRQPRPASPIMPDQPATRGSSAADDDVLTK